MSAAHDMDLNELERALEELKAEKGESNMSEYQKALLKWCRVVDKRYAWVILIASHVLMIATFGPYRIYGLFYVAVVKQGVYNHEDASLPSSTIFSVENTIGPITSIIIYYISFRKSILIGALLVMMANGLAAISQHLWTDVLLIGCVQGIGYSFIFMPFMEIINSYFIRYRNLALGAALSGATISNFILMPIFQWLLNTYPWRYGYYGTFCVASLNLLVLPFLKPNPRPVLQEKEIEASSTSKFVRNSSFARFSVRALNYRNSTRSQSSIGSKKTPGRISVVSMNPYPTSVGLERKISNNLCDQLDKNSIDRRSKFPMSSLEQYENENHDTDPSFKLIKETLKTPAFHLIWLNELIYFWLFSILCLIVVDYGMDRGLTKWEAENLLNCQAVGELVGRLGLTYLVDLGLLSNRVTIVIVLYIISVLLVLLSFASGVCIISILVSAVFAFLSVQFILIDGLLVDYLGERKVTFGFGLSSCISGILMFPRSVALGYFKDQLGSYSPFIVCLSISTAVGASFWLVEPILTKIFFCKRKDQADKVPEPSKVQVA